MKLARVSTDNAYPTPNIVRGASGRSKGLLGIRRDAIRLT